MAERTRGLGSLAIGGAAAVVASACCLGPLVLVTLGITGAWIGNLTALEPYRPWFIAAALLALIFAYRAIFRQADECAPSEVCASSRGKVASKTIFYVVCALVGIAMVFPYLFSLFD